MTLWVASISLCVGASQRIPLSVLARNPHKGLVHEISHEIERMREGRSQRSVGRRGQSREGRSQQNGVDETSRQNRSVRRWESGIEEASQQKSERRLLGPVDLQMSGWPTREDKSALLVALWGFSLEYTLALAHRMHKKCQKLPSIALGANPSLIVRSSFLPPSRLCILCVGKGMWNTLGQRSEKPQENSEGHE